MPKKLSYEIIRENIERYGYKLISKEYKNSRSYLEIKCSKGHQYKVKYNVFQQGSRCPICSRNGINKKYDYIYVKEYIAKYGYELISDEYINCEQYLEVRCSSGHSYKTTFSNFKSGSRCKKCKGIATYSYEEVKSFIESNDYKLLSSKMEYSNSHSDIEIQCNSGHVYYTKFYSFKRRHKCPYCAERKLNFDMVNNYIMERGYVVLSHVYKNNHEPLTLKCPVGHIFNMSYNKFQNGCRCTKCASSNGEKEVAKVLDSLHIKYVEQYRFKDCVGDSRTLPFDFYIKEYETCIEFDGIQHYKPVEFFGGEEGFNTTTKYDTIKNNYCYRKNINLIRISYQDFNNIEKIIRNEFKNVLRENFND